MKYYEDRANKRHVWEENFDFIENGGYFLNITYSPSNIFWKLLHKFKLIKTEEPVAEIQTGPMNWEYICVNLTNNLEAKGLFLTTKGVRTVRMTFPHSVVFKYEVKINLERLYS